MSKVTLACAAKTVKVTQMQRIVKVFFLSIDRFYKTNVKPIFYFDYSLKI